MQRNLFKVDAWTHNSASSSIEVDHFLNMRYINCVSKSFPALIAHLEVEIAVHFRNVLYHFSFMTTRDDDLDIDAVPTASSDFFVAFI